MKEDNLLSRRAFVRQLSAVGFAGVFLSACGSEQQSEDEASTQAADATSPCSDLSGLTSAEIQVREDLDYVSDSPQANQVCSNCQFWLTPESGKECGGCVVMEGPVHPEGFCNSWAPQPA